MNSPRPKTLFTPLFIAGLAVAVAAGFFMFQWMNQSSAIETVKPLPVIKSSGPAPANGILGTRRPDFTLQDPAGSPVSVSHWDGKVLLINFWATWCPPCRKEMPAFVEMHEKYRQQGFEIVGIALDDAQAVIDFTDAMGVEYALLIGDDDAVNVARQFGNRYGVLPYSVLLDREGKVRFIRPGELSGEVLESELRKLL